VRIGVTRETKPGETRVSATPKTVDQLRKLGYEVVVEAGAGAAADFSDEAFVEAGATIGSAADVWAADPMVDTVPHPVVKLFPLAGLEPDLAGGSIDDRVFAAFDAERRHLDAAALANGRHAATTPTDAAAPRNAAYRSKHSA
jgi:hypothetical protein